MRRIIIFTESLFMINSSVLFYNVIFTYFTISMIFKTKKKKETILNRIKMESNDAYVHKFCNGITSIESIVISIETV